eukprot:CFRG6709T1
MNGRESRGNGKRSPRSKQARSASPNRSRGTSPSPRAATPSGKATLDPNDIQEYECGTSDVDVLLPGEDVIENLLESLSLKRSELREEAIESAVWGMRTCHPQQYLEEKNELSTIIVRSVKNSSASDRERISALEALQLIFVHRTDEGRESLYNSLANYLDVMIRDYTLSPELREAAIFTISFGCFLGCNDREKISDLMEALFDLAEVEQRDNVPLAIASLDAWALLLTCVSDETAESLFYEKLSDFEEFLFSPKMELRISAAEVFALWLEEARESDEEFDTNSSDELEEIYQKLGGMVQEFESKSNSRTDRQKQRSTLGEVLNYIKDAEDVPMAIIRLPHDEVNLDTWAEKRQMDTIKQVVKSGLQFQLQVNSCLRSIFSLTGPVCLSREEQREFTTNAQRARKTKYETVLHKKSSYVKGRDKQRTAERAIKRMQKKGKNQS